MYELYSLNSKFDKTQTCGSFVGVKTNKLFRLDIKKSVKDRHIHFTLKESFEYCDLLPNENPKDALFKRGRIYSKSNSPKNEFVLWKISAKPGNYFPRIYRPILEQNSTVSPGRNQRIEQLEEIVYNYPVSIPYNTTILVSGVNQLVTLTSLLDEILNTVYPSSSNLKTFGHQIKNLLVLSCIEVEAQLKGIYKANEVSQKKNYYTTDYIKLKDPMQLDRYSVKLPLYPDLKSFEPFKKWNSKEPTKSLKWYDNYNAVKHNGETEFHRLEFGYLRI
jgi:hypothetical protein